MEIQVLKPVIDNGRSKITLFNVDGKIIEQKYNYGRGFGFKFLTQYPSLENYENRMFSTGSKTIYSSTREQDCTLEGREIESALSKIKL